MSGRFLVYGAYGYTGELIARFAAEAGDAPILAGRSADKLAPVVADTGFEQRVFGLDDPDALDRGLDGVDVVIHCAGPFSRLSKPMADACLRTGTHYLDITGEIVVFETLAARNKEAAGAGVMLMPGVGMDVVPSDCLAAHLKGRLPSATHLRMGFLGLGGGVSHGTATTIVENLGEGGAIRRDGRIQVVKAPPTREVDFGRGPKFCVAIPWGDVSTAYHTTGIPNIEVYVPVPRAAAVGMRVISSMKGLLQSGPVQKLIKSRVDARPAGPTDEQRANARTIFWGEVTDEAGGRAESRLECPEGYTVTALTALEIARRTCAGAAKPGFQTPGGLFGADFICEFEGVERTDL